MVDDTQTQRLAPQPEQVSDEVSARPGRDGKLCIERVTRFESQSTTIVRRGAALADIAEAGLLLNGSDVAEWVCPDGAASLAEVGQYE